MEQFQVDPQFVIQTLQNKIIEMTQQELGLKAIIGSLQFQIQQLKVEKEECTITKEQL